MRLRDKERRKSTHFPVILEIRESGQDEFFLPKLGYIEKCGGFVS
jgi:hypothetical protein